MDILRLRIFRRYHEITNILILLVILFLLLFIVGYIAKLHKKNGSTLQNIHIQNDWLSIRHYNIYVKIDPTNYSFSAKVKVAIESNKNNLRELSFVLSKFDDIVIKDNGEELQYVSANKYIKIFLNKPLKTGEIRNLEFTYKANIGYLTSENGVGNVISPDGAFWSFSSGWYPYIPNCNANATITYSVPPSNLVVSAGKLISQVTGKNYDIFVYETLKPTYKYSFAVRSYQKESVYYEDLRITLYHYNLSIDETRLYLSKIIDYISYLSKLISPLPYKSLNIVQIPRINIETEDDFSLIAISDDFFSGTLENFENRVAHKLGKQWFGNLVNCNPDIDYLICTAIPEYLYYMYLKESVRKNVAKTYLERKRNLYFFLKNIYPKEEIPLSDTKNINFVLTKGFYFVHSLRFMLGDKFNLMLKKINSDFRNKIVTYKDTLELINAMYGKDLTPFFDFINLSNRSIDFVTNLKKKRNRRFYDVSVDVKKNGYDNELPVELMFNTISSNMIERIIVKGKEETFKYVYDNEPYEAIVDPYFRYLRDDGEYKLKNNELNILEPISALKRSINERDTSFIEPFVAKDYNRFTIFREVEILIAASMDSFTFDDIYVLERNKKDRTINAILPFTFKNNNKIDTILFTFKKNMNNWEIIGMGRGVY